MTAGVIAEPGSGGVVPFAIRVPDEDLADLHRRLDGTRWPDAGWSGWPVWASWNNSVGSTRDQPTAGF